MAYPFVRAHAPSRTRRCVAPLTGHSDRPRTTGANQWHATRARRPRATSSSGSAGPCLTNVPAAVGRAAGRPRGPGADDRPAARARARTCCADCSDRRAQRRSRRAPGSPGRAGAVQGPAERDVRRDTAGMDTAVDRTGPPGDQHGAETEPHQRVAARGDIQAGPLRRRREIGEGAQDGGRVGDHACASSRRVVAGWRLAILPSRRMVAGAPL